MSVAQPLREVAAASPTSGSPYVAYSYAYPHKSAYRLLPEPVPLEFLWAGEDCRALFLYVHVPFCEMRCGFCNLFTAAQPAGEAVAAHAAALRRQVVRTAQALGPAARFARIAIGGGTPTLLDAPVIEDLFDDLERHFGARPADMPCSVETSPATATKEKLAVLAHRGVSRVSLGVQTFDEQDARGCGRPQSNADVFRALYTIRDARIPVLNVDLIYGIPGQTSASWCATIDTALKWQPEEFFLYPLYVRPLTGLDRRAQRRASPLPASDERWDRQRLQLYRLGRDRLLAAGYEQLSMRLFRRRSTEAMGGPAYCCQDDGMVGLGCGARSYARGLHYSSEFAVSQSGVRSVLADYAARTDEEFASARYGFPLDEQNQRRRWLIQSLLQASGADDSAYERRFASNLRTDFSALALLVEQGLAAWREDVLCLTAAGLERSDAIGPWLYAPEVRARMAHFELR